MPESRYSPFDKDLSQVTIADLERLREVPEGWYVEYKREVPASKSIAKSVSALANTYGGWLFYGIEEKSSGDRTAGAFPGIPTTDVPTQEMRIRQAVATLLSPPAYFETRVLNGPDASLGLAAEHAVIAISVALSYDAPHVHADGRIYRRVADASEPRPETDRHILDLLRERGEQQQVDLRELVTATPETSENEREASYLELFILPTPWRENLPRHRVQFDEFVACMEGPTTEYISLPFDNVFSTATGYVARQATANAADRLVLTWRYTVDGVSHVTIPFPSIALEPRHSDASAFFEGYSHTEAFFTACREARLGRATVVDLNFVFSVLWGVMRQHEKLASCAKTDFPFDMKLRVRGIWRRVPFIDTTIYQNFYAKFGIPVVQVAEQSSPPYLGFHRLVPQGGHDPDLWTGLKCSLAFGNVCEIFGLPIEKTMTGVEWYPELTSLIERAKKVQVNRNVHEGGR